MPLPLLERCSRNDEKESASASGKLPVRPFEQAKMNATFSQLVSGCVAVFTAAVPEPETLSLLAAGLALLAGWGSRKRRTRHAF